MLSESEVLSHVEKYLSYDPISGHFTYRVARGPRKAGSRAGGINGFGYRCIGIGPSGKQKQYLEHRLAFLLMEGRWPKLIDHINGIKDDNRYENLRECTQQQNCMNTSSRRGASSKYKGVRRRVDTYYGEDCVRYLAQIYVNKKNKHLGYFVNEDDAARVYNLAARMYFGQYSKINEIPLSIHDEGRISKKYPIFPITPTCQ